MVGFNQSEVVVQNKSQSEATRMALLHPVLKVLILTFTFMTNNNEIFQMSNNKIFNTCGRKYQLTWRLELVLVKDNFPVET